MKGRETLIKIRKGAGIGSIHYYQSQGSSSEFPWQAWPHSKCHIKESKPSYPKTSTGRHSHVCTHTSMHIPFSPPSRGINPEPLKLLESHFRMSTALSAFSSPCITVLEKGSSVQVSRLTLNVSQSILAHLLEIRTTVEQSINK